MGGPTLVKPRPADGGLDGMPPSVGRHSGRFHSQAIELGAKFLKLLILLVAADRDRLVPSLGFCQRSLPPCTLGTSLFLGALVSGLDHRESLVQQFLVLGQALELGTCQVTFPAHPLGLAAAQFVLFVERAELFEELAAGFIEDRPPLGLFRLQLGLQGGQPLVQFLALGQGTLLFSFALDLAHAGLLTKCTVFPRGGLLQPLRPLQVQAELDMVLVLAPYFLPGRFRVFTGAAQHRFQSTKLLLQLRVGGRQPAVFGRRGLFTPFGELQRVANVKQVFLTALHLIPRPFGLFTGSAQSDFESAKLRPQLASAVQQHVVFHQRRLLTPLGQFERVAEVKQVLLRTLCLVPRRFGLLTSGAQGRFQSAELLLELGAGRRQPVLFCRDGLLTPLGQFEHVTKVDQFLMPAPYLIPGRISLVSGGIQGRFEGLESVL